MSSAVRTRPDRPPEGMTLGWGVYAWMIENLVHSVTGEPVDLDDEELEFVLLHYQVDERGKFVYRRSAMRRARGSGKSPLGAKLACAELAGPVRFGGWGLRDGHGNFSGQPCPSPWVQISATSLAQTRPIMNIAVASWSEKAIDTYGLVIGIEAITKSAPPRGLLQTVPNNPRSLRGGRVTAFFADEVSEWVKSNGGHEAMVRVRANLAKDATSTARLIEFSNAFVPEEDSHAERTYRAFVKQTESGGSSKILYDSLEADPSCDLTDPDQLRVAIRQANPNSDADHVQQLVDVAQDSSVSVSVFCREHLNQIVTSEDSLIDLQQFDLLTQGVPELKPGDPVTMGFDGSLTDDGTAIVAFRTSDRSFHLLNYWEPDPWEENWRLDQEMVDETFRSHMGRYQPDAVACDVYPFDSWVHSWERDYGPKLKARVSGSGALIYDHRAHKKPLVHALMALVNEIESSTADSRLVKFFPSLLVREHWSNAKRRDSRYGFSFGKVTKSSKRKVDIVAACLNAYVADRSLSSERKVSTVPARTVQLKPGVLYRSL